MRIAFEESDLESSGVEERQLSKRKDLVHAIESFLKVYNETAAPFDWTKIRVSKKSPEVNTLT